MVTKVAAYGIDRPFDQPFSSGTNPSSGEVPNRYQVAINGVGFLIDVKKYDRETIPLARQPSDESVEPGEQSLNTQGVWRRSQDNWFLGSGQEYLDNRFAFISVYVHSGEDPSVRTRFWRSKGVNPWTEGGLSLLPECNQKGSSTGTGQLVMAVGSYLYWWDGTTLKFTSNPTASSPSWTTVNYPTGLSLSAWPTIVSMCTDGNNVYVTAGAYGVFTTTAGATTSTNMRPTPSAPTVTPAVTGVTTYTYYIVATDANGYKSLVSAAGTITNGTASLSATDNNLITWTAVPGAVSYDLLADSTHSIALGLTQTTYTDTSYAKTAYTSPTATTLNLQPTFLQYGQGFLVAGANSVTGLSQGASNNLVQILQNGFTALIWTHPNKSFAWTAMAGAPMCFYVAGSSGNVSELYATQISTTTGNLAPPYLAGSLTTGEVIRSIRYYQGIVTVTTSLGVRTGQPADSQGHLTIGPLIAAPGDSKCCTVYGPYVYFGWSLFDTNDGIYTTSVQSSGLGRLFLSEFADSPLLPAYATDVMATDGTTGTVTTCDVDTAGNAYFIVDGSGIWGPDANVVASGYIEPGYLRYGLIENKTIVWVDVRHDPLNGSIQFQIVPFGNASAITIGTSNGQGSTSPGSLFGADYLVGEAFMPILVLNRSSTDTTKGPTLRRWTCAAIPVVSRQDQIVVPLRVAKLVRSPDREGEDLRYDPIAVFNMLKTLERNATVCTYQEGNASYTVIIDEVKIEPDKWADDFSFFEGLIYVKLITLDTVDA